MLLAPPVGPRGVQSELLRRLGLDVLAFLGVLVAGCVPLPIYPPVRRTQIEEHLRRQAAILNNAEVPLLITTPS